jgi:hypothetical protein
MEVFLGDLSMPGNFDLQDDVFISYHPSDREWVQQVLVPRLEAANLKVVIEPRDFQVGLPKLVNIEQAVDRCRHTLIVMTPNWLNSARSNLRPGRAAQAADPPDAGTHTAAAPYRHADIRRFHRLGRAR